MISSLLIAAVIVVIMITITSKTATPVDDIVSGAIVGLQLVNGVRNFIIKDSTGKQYLRAAREDEYARFDEIYKKGMGG